MHPGRLRRKARIWLVGALALLCAAAAALYLYQDDILEYLLDPKIPYTVYKPPPPPDFALASAWDQLPAHSADRPVAVFFVHPTTFDGGRDWNGPIGDAQAARRYQRIVAPNYAAPFAAAGAVYAPRYRQASAYTSLSLFDDALEAREFAYGDVATAFDWWLAHLAGGRPFILVGVEQGGRLAARLLAERIAPDPALRRRLVAAYLIETPVPADEFGSHALVPACDRRAEAGCAAAWISAGWTDLPRALAIMTRSRVWTADGRLTGLNGRKLLCVNPLLGAKSDAAAPAKLNLGAAAATGLEWGVRPGFMIRQVGAQCVDGVLRFSRPRSAALRARGSWLARLRPPPYNLFWADLEADALARVAAYDAKISPPARAASPAASRTVTEE